MGREVERRNIKEKKKKKRERREAKGKCGK